MSSRNRLQRIDRLAHASGIPLYPVHGPAEIEAVLIETAPGPGDQLIVIGGDGTLQAAVSQLAAAAEAGKAPSLCMLGGGRTNFTARDLGSHKHLLRSLEHLIRQPQDWHPVERPVLRISGSEHGDLYGFFVAGALVDAVIRDCHDYRARSRGWLATGHAATPWRLAQLAALGLAGRKRFSVPQIQLETSGLGVLEGAARILLVTSLQHASGRLNPYAARGHGSIRLTVIQEFARNFWRRLPALLQGRFGADDVPENGFLSGNTERLSVTGLPSICLDGQEYELDPSQRIVIEPGPLFRFQHP